MKELDKMKQEMFISAYINRANKKMQNVFKRLLIEKLNSDTFNLKKLNYEDLKRMCEIEMVSNQQLAFLYDTNRQNIQHFRQKWAIKSEGLL